MKNTIRNFDPTIQKNPETLVVIKNLKTANPKNNRETFVYFDNDDEQHQLDMSSNTFNS